MSGIFEGCTSLSSIPNISNWETEGVEEMDNLFKGCITLAYLPNVYISPNSFKSFIDYDCISTINLLNDSKKINYIN